MNNVLEKPKELAAGLQEIDKQHMDLLNILNDLNESLQGVRRKEVRTEVLNKLIEFIKVQFSVEESLMRILDYPDYREHKAEHDRLLLKVGELGEDGTTPTHELLIFLRKWLFNHIMKVDKHYEQYFFGLGAR
ncbi:MAG: hemerythrin family protein [Gammaproteobacteria bacterium]|nr:hemerythrin family protein [Gammaproteobacteria bacterium]